jgi:hypothetical protein
LDLRQLRALVSRSAQSPAPAAAPPLGSPVTVFQGDAR